MVSTYPENSPNYIWLAKWLDLIQPQIIFIVSLTHQNRKNEDTFIQDTVIYATVYALYYIVTCIAIYPFKVQKQYASDDMKIVCLVQLNFGILCHLK